MKRCSECGERLCDWCGESFAEETWPLSEFVKIGDEWVLQHDASRDYGTCARCLPIHGEMIAMLERGTGRDDWHVTVQGVLRDAVSPVSLNEFVRAFDALIQPTTEH